MNLLELPKEIQEDLQKPPAPLEIFSFSERRLRQILACGNEESQMSRWGELIRNLGSKVDQDEAHLGEFRVNP